MTTLVLVPGSWAGGWIWKKVTPLLRSAGHEVYTPTLTGLGERVHLAHPGIDLDTHITDVVNLLAFEDLRDVVLVGWSYSGMVITGVADQVPERVAQMIYFDATVPDDGQSEYDTMPDVQEQHVAEQEAEAAGTPGWQPVPVDYIRAQVEDERDRAWLLDKLTPNPIATSAQPIRLRHRRTEAFPRAFVFCTEGKGPGSPSAATAAQLRHDPGWRYREVAAGHLAPVTAPRETAEVLLSLISS
jgi:pimeloyl-ACP methyl ester carboxylesterase